MQVGDHLYKEESLKLDSERLYNLQVKRRELVKQYMLEEAATAENPMIHPIFTLLFNWLESEVSTWVGTGDASFVHEKLENAPTENNEKVLSIFGNAEGTPKSIHDLLQLSTETQTNVIGYLKYYIK